MEKFRVLVIAADLPSPGENETLEQKYSRDMTRRILAAVAQNEAERASARMVRKLASMFKDGDTVGRHKHWASSTVRGRARSRSTKRP